MKSFDSVEHAKAHAKKLTLPLLQSVIPNAKLANALELIAKESGFKTWRALKSHLESPAYRFGLQNLGMVLII
ncbi:hypothetical protein Pcar_3238 [Syntrophotalea carbinolica DSM 2380]|uniref:Glyoxalase-related protein domain-containing protein n=1 Tax=Syntrophotalea carbinolica (strain DSM 2380 / NBRC 103641 / GraBd1) TaxID=338963 RepID=Q0C6S9_SYNC1|nr:glyoxalase superfamily protein [Syntrophotalea carbinolica]ABI81858.1 hypothetical protein Pcar_3238 [Syntrophotalea carbinolica DSM 2380]